MFHISAQDINFSFLMGETQGILHQDLPVYFFLAIVLLLL